jgi:hypothetical protein
MCIVDRGSAVRPAASSLNLLNNSWSRGPVFHRSHPSDKVTMPAGKSVQFQRDSAAKMMTIDSITVSKNSTGEHRP